MDDRLVGDLADAIFEGASVDWDAAETQADEAARPLIAQLRVVAAIADAHRSTALPTETWSTLRLLEKVGQGSFAEVYRAWDARLDREVALKLLRRLDDDAAGGASAVVDEGRMLARVRHPNVVTVHGADRIAGRVGLWMEFIHGRTLEQVLHEQGAFGAQEAAVIGLDLCRALSAVHGAGLLHRDVKTQNVMREEGGRIVLMDFGTGLHHDEVDASAGTPTGTPLYVAPEVLAGHGASVRSDIYSLGVLLYHLLTLSYPVAGGSLQELLDKQARGERTLLRDARPDLPEKLVGVVERALSRLPEDRYESAGAMEAALLAVVATHPVAPARPGDSASDLAATPVLVEAATARAPRRARWARNVIAAMGALSLAIGLGFWLGKRAAPAPAAPPVHRLHRLTELAGIEELPALSPDGKSVAFSAHAGRRRQIFVRLLAGGAPLQITHDDADHELPRWSPDSSSIVYYTSAAPGDEQGTLWEVSALGGSARRVTGSISGADLRAPDGRLTTFQLAGKQVELVTLSRDGSASQVVTRLAAGSYCLYPRWSPDARWIAFQRGDGVRFDLFVVPATGGEPRRLTDDQSLIAGLGWLPDSSGIVFSSSRASTLPYLPTFSLWEVRLEDRRLRPLTSGESSLMHPDVGRAGAIVASRLRLQHDLWRFPVDGSPRDNVLGEQRLTRQTGTVLTPTPAPDDRQVAFLSDSGGHTNLWVLATDSGELRQITNERDPAIAMGVPLWSPDGTSIAFVSSRGNTGLLFGLWLVDPDGSNLRQLVKRGLGAAWSADGRWLYYVESGAGVIKKVAARGGSPLVVRTDRARNVGGVHGSTLYYTVERPLVDGRPELEVHAATPENGPSRLLARLPASRVPSWQIVNPALSPDGRWLAQALTDHFTTNIWALSTGTGEWRQITDFGDRSTFIARRVSWSSDGRFVYAAVGDGDADIVLLEGLIAPTRD